MLVKWSVYTGQLKAELDGEEDVVSASVTLTIDCPQDPVVINQPETITDCVNDFVVNGTANPGASITLYEGSVDGPELGTSTADETGFWEITLNASNANLGAGESGVFTLVAEAELDGEEDVVSASVTLTIDCPQDPVVINQPETITDCVNDFVVNGTANPGASITLYEGSVDGPELGTSYC